MPLRIVAPDGLVRHAHVVLPRNWHELAPVPIVLAYSGGGAAAAGTEGMAGKALLHEVGFSGKDEDQFVTVYLEAWAPTLPEGAGGSWSVGYTGDDALVFEPDDVGFTKTVLDLLQRRMSRALAERWGRPGVDAIDPDRVYAVGFSNGGMFVYRLVLELVDWLIASFCVCSGTIGGQREMAAPLIVYDPNVATGPIAPSSFLQIHGLPEDPPLVPGDPVVPFEGGIPDIEEVALPNVLEWRGLERPWDPLLPVFQSAPTAEMMWKNVLGLGKVVSVLPSIGHRWRYPAVFTDTAVASGAGGTMIHAYGAFGHQWADPKNVEIAQFIWQFFLDPTKLL